MNEPVRAFSEDMPKDWVIVPFETVLFEPVRNGIYKKKEFHGHGTKVVNMGELFAYDFIDVQKMKRVEITEKEAVKFRLLEGDLLFARRSFVLEGSGKCSLVRKIPELTTFESSLIRARPNSSKVDSKFLYYLFSSPLGKSAVLSIATRTAVSGIRGSDLAKLDLPIPSLPIQRKIASILSAYDDLIENNLRRIRILEEMAQNLYREWFVKFRFPGHENARFVDGIPEGWRQTSLGEVSSNYDRMRKPLSKMQRSERQGIYPYYGAAKVFDYIDDYLFDGVYLLVAEDGSVITPERHPVLQYVSEKFWANNHTHIIQGKLPISTEFIYLMLSILDISGYITGAAQPKINQGNLNRIPVLVPDYGLLIRFNAIVSDIFRESIILQKKNTTLRRTRDLLLPRLISGELDVSELDITIPEETT